MMWTPAVMVDERTEGAVGGKSAPRREFSRIGAAHRPRARSKLRRGVCADHRCRDMRCMFAQAVIPAGVQAAHMPSTQAADVPINAADVAIDHRARMPGVEAGCAPDMDMPDMPAAAMTGEVCSAAKMTAAACTTAKMSATYMSAAMCARARGRSRQSGRNDRAHHDAGRADAQGNLPHGHSSCVRRGNLAPRRRFLDISRLWGRSDSHRISNCVPPLYRWN